MEENITMKQKLMNAYANIRQMMLADRRILFGSLGLGILIVLFLLVAGLSLFRSPKNTESVMTDESPLPGSSQERKATVKKAIANTTLQLVISGNKKTYKVNDLIMITLVGDSKNIQVRGYDASFKFDQNKVSFVSEKNLFPNMQYMRRIRGNWLILSATQPLDSVNSLTFSKTKLMEVTFKATAVGTAYFPMSYIPDSYGDSNLIDISSNDMLSGATGIVVQIVQ